VTGFAGTCTTVSDSSPPHGGRLRCEGAGPCKGACDGTKPDGCTLPDSSKLCAPPSCTSEVATPAAACNGTGACATPETKSCFPYACGDTSCRTLCAAPTDCVRGYDCIAQHCVPLGQTMADVDAALEVSTDDSATMVPVTVDAGVADSSRPSTDAAADAEASPEADIEVAPIEVEQGGCGCGTASGGSVSAWWGLPFLAVIAARARRARRRRSDRLS